MAKSKQKICRLCLNDIKKGSFKTIDNIQREMLEVLLIGMDLKICEETVICDKCAITLQECFDFKSKCFFVEDCIVPFMVDNERVDLKLVIEKKMKIGKQVQLDNHKICRLCMQVVQNNDFIYFDNLTESASIRDMLQTCLSELDVNSTIDALICKICVKSLKNYHDFKESCLDVERKIKEYQSEEFESNSTEKVELSDLLKKKNVKRNVKNGRAESGSGSQSCSKYFEAKTQTTVSSHMNTHKDAWDIEQERYEILKQKQKNSLSDIKKDCMTDPRGCLKSHLYTHKNADEVKRLSCKHCSFKSKHTSNMLRHTREVHGNDFKKNKCSRFTYETIEKNNLQKHQVSHLSPGEAPVLHCATCDHKLQFENTNRNM